MPILRREGGRTAVLEGVEHQGTLVPGQEMVVELLHSKQKGHGRKIGTVRTRKGTCGVGGEQENAMGEGLI